MEIKEIASQLNELAGNYQIGKLQELRTKIHGKRSRTYQIFSASTSFEAFAFHDGGRHELQFNIGSERFDDRNGLRYGVAFSLEPSRALPDVAELYPKISRINYYLRAEAESFPGFSVWYWTHEGRTPESIPGPFDPRFIRPGNFLFLGKWVRIEDLKMEDILTDLDLLLPLYVFVEQGDYWIETRTGSDTIQPGCPPRQAKTTATRQAGDLDISLRHNELQAALFRALSDEYGKEAVFTEYPLESGGRVDAMINQQKGKTFFEIKVAPSARTALREAIGQLLEYAHWPNVLRAKRLVVVGEFAPTRDTKDYLVGLRRRFNINLEYRQLSLETGQLSDPV